jgi:hypothetical protein
MASERMRAPWRRDAGAVPGSDLSGVTELDLIDVTLVTEVSGDPVEVPSLGLGFNEQGMTVRTPDGAPYVSIPWACILHLSADAVSEPLTSSGAVRLDVRSNRKRHRFVVPNVEPRALTGSLGAVSALYGRAELVTSGKGGHQHH